MKLLSLTVALMFVASATSVDDGWGEYKKKYHKHYSPIDDILRHMEYSKAIFIIENHNDKYEKGKTTYLMAVNQFADWFSWEKDSILGYKPDLTNPGGKPYEPCAGKPVPESINWVKKGAVTSVKDQKQCGSDYAFSAAGALEGLMFVTQNKTASISAQEFLDCSKNDQCRGGRMTTCFEYVKGKNGTHKSEDYPYLGRPEKCKAAKGTIPVTCNNYEVVKGEKNLTAAVGTVAPVSIGFAVTYDFFFYNSGIYDGGCRKSPNHAMLAVGYDKDNKTGKDYWLIKNSWGTTWGEKGYVRVPRNVNMCNLGDQASFPVIAK